MRTISAAQERLLTSGNYAAHLRVSIKDSGGTWRDMASLAGHNWVKSASWGAEIDNGVGTAQVEMVRAHGRDSLAIFDESTRINRLVGSAYAPLAQAGRSIKIEQALTRPLDAPVSGDWMNVFEGHITGVAWNADPVVLQCTDLAGEIQRAFMEWEWVFGDHESNGPLWVWEPGVNIATYREGQITHCIPPTPNGFIYAIPAGAGHIGTTGTEQPAWSTDYSEFQDGTQYWIGSSAYDPTEGDTLANVIRHILTNPSADKSFYWHFGGASSPGWAIKPFIQERMSCREACANLAAQCGWALHERWNETLEEWLFTLWEPDRDATTALRTFGPGAYHEITAMSQSIDNVRNVVRVIFPDSASIGPDGNPRISTVQAEDTDSIAKYGRLFCEIAEGSTSQIDTETEADALAAAVVSDLAEPIASVSVDMKPFPFAELGDLYAFSPNGVHLSVEKKLAVTGIRHTASAGKCRTVLTCRGKPSGGVKAWHRRIAMPGNAKPATSLAATSPTVTVTNGEGYSDIKLSKACNYEIHASSSSATFAPTAANRWAQGFGDYVRLWTNASWYCVVIVKDSKGRYSNLIRCLLAPT